MYVLKYIECINEDDYECINDKTVYNTLESKI